MDVYHSIQEPIVTAHLTALSPGVYVEGIWYKAVEQFVLPKVGELIRKYNSVKKALIVINLHT